MENKKDIFISYKNDGEGNNFAARISSDLEKMGYNVYFNPNEQHAGNFPERLSTAIKSCNDFLLILTHQCLEQLIEFNKVDWIREELLTAYDNNKNIIPLLMPGVSMPKDKDIMPECLRFLPDTDAIAMTESYNKSPLEMLLNWMQSKPVQNNTYMHSFNNNVNYDVKKDFELLLEQANSGNLQAMYEVAFYYYDGIASETNYNEAAKWFFKLSDCNDENIQSQANSALGAMYYCGVIPKESQSYEKSLFYREKAVKSTSAQSQAAYMRKIGSGCDFNFEDIDNRYKNVKNGDSFNSLEHALFYIKYGEFEKAISVLETINEIIPESEYQLGLLYKLGVHTKPAKPDYITAAYHLHTAADQGHTLAAYEYGAINFNPTGKYKKNFKEAEKYLKIAADNGISDAQHKLAWIYEFGLSEMKQPHKALFYYEKAAAQGNIGSIIRLISLYQTADFKNYEKAFTYAKKAADMGDAGSAYQTANFYFLGRGCKCDENKALEYYDFAYKRGIYKAKIMMNKISITSNS